MEGERSEAWFSGFTSWTNISGVVMYMGRLRRWK